MSQSVVAPKVGSLLAASLLTACALPRPPYDGTTKETPIALGGSNLVTVFVYPRTAPQGVAQQAALAKKRPCCERAFGTRMVRITKAQDGSFAVPHEWEIEGTCG
ncbi:hypothetical protein [Candidatus Rhodobacter oscarellae]|uniref:hypothetical protein n=1 Tax=Candidatus Rhodobacter oscarellae TaxID=1675527 RepID=UPI000A99A05C|nr:hypothetical protein [Candidatus Rhodobacter lobularis]